MPLSDRAETYVWLLRLSDGQGRAQASGLVSSLDYFSKAIGAGH
jgi:hypothetical protein